MSTAANLTQAQYRAAREIVASQMDESRRADEYERPRAERLLDAGLIDIAALNIEGVTA